jgi:hypothetical protein
MARNIGLEVESLGMYVDSQSSADEKVNVEAEIRRALDNGGLISLLHLDHQLGLGYDSLGQNAALWPRNTLQARSLMILGQQLVKCTHDWRT